MYMQKITENYTKLLMIYIYIYIYIYMDISFIVTYMAVRIADREQRNKIDFLY